MKDQNQQAAAPLRASICMATYNGSQYVEEQLESILAQLGPEDEIVIVDDASTDDTVARIRRFADPRIRLIGADANQGYVRSFEQAVLASRGGAIFLADQDDVWMEGRLEAMLAALETHAVVASNFDVLGGGERPRIPRLRAADSGRHRANLWGILVGYRAYYGCGMAFRREVLGQLRAGARLSHRVPRPVACHPGQHRRVHRAPGPRHAAAAAARHQRHPARVALAQRHSFRPRGPASPHGRGPPEAPRRGWLLVGAGS